MKGFNRHTRVVLGSFLSTWLICTPAWADDTEIYFGGSTTVTVKPNVLFVLDTSSSMNQTDGGETTRLERMKMALGNILNTAQDINVGLMRFSDPGGPVLYPIRDIDGTLSGTPGTTSVLTGTVDRTIEVSEDDAEQSSLGVMRLNSTALEMTEVPPTAAGSVDIPINFYKDDAEENVDSGAVNSTSSDLELAHEDGLHKQLIGLRFQNVNIPQGATITSASIEFEVDSKRTGDVALRIYGQDADTASYFVDSNNGDISKRARTAASALWSITDTPSPNQSLFTSDISAVVQAVVDRTGWAANNHMAFILEHESGTGYREVETVDGEADAAAILHVTYEAAETSGPQVTGLRFNEINVPQGATITSASLTFTAHGDTGGTTDLVVLAEYAGHSEPFTGDANDISSRTATDSVGVGMVDNTVTAWTDGSSYTFSNGDAGSIADVVQAVVSHPEWCGGNSLSFFVQGTGLRTAKAYEANPSLAPKLNITYDTASYDPATACYTREYAKIVTASSDDAEQYASGAVHLDSTDLELVTDNDNSSGNQTVGLRFNDLQLSPGTSLNHAYLEFAVDEVEPAAVTTLTLQAEDADNSTTFTTASGNISTRPRTTASVTWNIQDQWPTEHGLKRSPNIAPLLNEVLARGGWTAGNSISFIITGSGNRVVEAFDGSTLAPRLVYYAKDADVPVSTNTVRADLKQMVSDIQYKPGTPLTDTLYEAARYFRGEGVDYGLLRGADTTTRREYTRVSHPQSYSGGTLVQPVGCTADNLDSSACAGEEITGSPVYTSPITESCQPNYIVLLTDGQPNSNSSAAKIQALTGDSSCTESDGKACALELVDYLANADQLSSLANDQKVRTYTIGFNFSDPWLANLAYRGDGAFYEAESAADLTSVFDSIVRSIQAVNTTFVEPSVTINQFNRFAHRDDVYFSLFKPQETAKWYGNLKKYQLKGSPATLYDNRNPQQPAIDPLTGFFSMDSKSFWSADEDGNQVEKGGTASRLPTIRNIYTNVASGSVLSVADNAVSENNTLITKDLLGIVGKTDSYRTGLLKWARGLDENDAPRFELGDPLHSRPELVTYDGTTTTPESSIFFGTNEGFLHAVDINTGIEQFAFIPKELLDNLDTYYINASVDPRPYGLDGGITIWSQDLNHDGDLKDEGDFAYLYIGMRRGGRHYYALDITDITNPKLMWQIDGGSGEFAHLGQTWSRPVKSRVMFNNVVREVLIFAGGYDSNQDDVSVRTVDTMGNAVYMVDALTGALLWSGGGGSGHDETITGMNYSIPSTVQVLDMNRDGRADQLYVGDMGGQIWRMDINNTATQLQHFVDVVKIADLAGSDAANNRRFYYPPDLALAIEGKDRYLSLAVGSGYRAHPLNTAIADRFYMIKLFDTHKKPASWTPLTEASLYDATENYIVQGDETQKAQAQVALSNTDVSRKQGWYLRMENSGEKVLSSSTTIQNQIVFTTYEPKAPDSGSCNPAQGTSRAYLVSLFNATPMLDINKDSTTTKADRVIQLQIGSIPATPTVIDTIDSKPTVWVGPERLDQVDTDVESIRTYWIEVSQ